MLLGSSLTPARSELRGKSQQHREPRDLLRQPAAVQRRQEWASTSHVMTDKRSGHRLWAAPKGPREPEQEEEDPLAALMKAAAEAGAKVEVEDDGGLWDDDYLEVVAEGDDPWDRDAFGPGGHSHGEDLPEILPAGPASPSAYAAEGGFRDVPATELARLCTAPNPPLVVDLRSEAEFAEGHVPGSISVPFETLSDAVKAGSLDHAKAGAVALACAAGSKAAQGAVRLQKVFGFADVVALRGGMLSYIAAGLPLEKGRGGLSQ